MNRSTHVLRLSTLTETLVLFSFDNTKRFAIVSSNDTFPGNSAGGGKAQMKEKGKIVNRGMGGFLNPPTHPEHTMSVESVDRNEFSMSLSAAMESTWLDDATRSEAALILAEWKPLPMDHPDVKDWVLQVMGYFAGCYCGMDANGNQSWNASDLRIAPDADPLLSQEIHAGVHLIRKFYPDFVLKAEHITEAYWGQKAEVAS